MFKPDSFSCSQKIQFKWDPPLLLDTLTLTISQKYKDKNKNKKQRRVSEFIILKSAM